jgi:TRAP-type C4-dicarboxylate transport system permease small subunit
MKNLLAAASDSIKLQPGEKSQFYNLGQMTVPAIISAAIKLVVVVAAVVFFFILVIGGIKWIASGGDKAKTESARAQITSALVGLVIVFAAWAIVALIKVFFNVDIFTLAIPQV